MDFIYPFGFRAGFLLRGAVLAVAVNAAMKLTASRRQMVICRWCDVILFRYYHPFEAEQQWLFSSIGAHLHPAGELSAASFGIECDFYFAGFPRSYRFGRKCRLGASASAVAHRYDYERFVVPVFVNL